MTLIQPAQKRKTAQLQLQCALLQDGTSTLHPGDFTPRSNRSLVRQSHSIAQSQRQLQCALESVLVQTRLSAQCGNAIQAQFQLQLPTRDIDAPSRGRLP